MISLNFSSASGGLSRFTGNAGTVTGNGGGTPTGSYSSSGGAGGTATGGDINITGGAGGSAFIIPFDGTNIPQFGGSAAFIGINGPPNGSPSANSGGGGGYTASGGSGLVLVEF